MSTLSMPAPRRVLLLASLLVACASVPGCNRPRPCDEVEGTCLNVYLKSELGERVDAVVFQVEGDGAFRHEHTWRSIPGGQILPIEVALPLPAEAQRTLKLTGAGQLENMTILVTAQPKVIPEVEPGSQRFVVLHLQPPGSVGGDPAQCKDGMKNGNETGVDCGGSCAPCEPGCADNLKNGEETGVDCGGGCAPCLAGQGCKQNADCAGDRCESGTCAMALGLASFSPENGPTTGGVQVTLKGELFTPDMQVLFGKTAATMVQVQADGKTAVVSLPPGAAGRADVVVRRGGDERRRADAFGYHYGTLRFNSVTPVPTGAKPYSVLMAQLNSKVDSKLDVAVLNEQDSDVLVLLGQGDGGFTRGERYPVTEGMMPFPLHIQAADFNADGVTDLVTANHRTPSITVLLGKGDGTFQAGAVYALPTVGKIGAVAAGDFNGDKIDDVAAVEVEGTKPALFVLLARGDKSGALQLSPMSHDLGGIQDSTVVAGKFNQDEFVDLAVPLGGNRTVRIFLGQGNGTFTAGKEFSADAVGTFTAAAGDLNGDRLTDLVLANRGSASVSYFQGNGDGTFRRPRHWAAGETPFAVALGDLDGDGRLDVAVPNWLSNVMGGSTATLLFNDGRGGLGRLQTAPVPLAPYGIALGDLTGDGKLDLVTVSVNPSNAMGIVLNESM
jgi:hypothetical protein